MTIFAVFGLAVLCIGTPSTADGTDGGPPLTVLACLAGRNGLVSVLGASSPLGGGSDSHGVSARAMGQAPGEVLESTVWVVAVCGSWVDLNDAPAS